MYKKAFMQAVERTDRFGLIGPNIKYEDKSRLSREKIEEFRVKFQALTQAMTYRDIAAQCLAAYFCHREHRFLRSVNTIFA